MREMDRIMSSLQLQHWVIYSSGECKRRGPGETRGIYLMLYLSKVLGLGSGILMGCARDSRIAIQVQELTD